MKTYFCFKTFCSGIIYIFAGRKGIKLGFKNLTLGLFDGKIFKPLDFTLQAEKALTKARHRKEQYKKMRDPKSAGAKRIRECHVSKITNGLAMLKRAVKQAPHFELYPIK